MYISATQNKREIAKSYRDWKSRFDARLAEWQNQKESYRLARTNWREGVEDFIYSKFKSYFDALQVISVNVTGSYPTCDIQIDCTPVVMPQWTTYIGIECDESPIEVEFKTEFHNSRFTELDEIKYAELSFSCIEAIVEYDWASIPAPPVESDYVTIQAPGNDPDYDGTSFIIEYNLSIIEDILGTQTWIEDDRVSYWNFIYKSPTVNNEFACLTIWLDSTGLSYNKNLLERCLDGWDVDLSDQVNTLVSNITFAQPLNFITTEELLELVNDAIYNRN
jgi:hypothetical protein